MSLPNPLRKQNEFISILQKQLRATERDLADQKWIHEQYLNSPSWKLTAPLRWTARRLRALRAWIIRRSPEKSENLTPRSDAAVNEDREDQAAGPGEDNLTVQEFNELYAPSYWVALQSLLASDAVLDLPAAAEPAVSIILVLSDRAELSMACLRSIRENVPEKFDLVIVDNASSGLVQKLLDRICDAQVIRNSEPHNLAFSVNRAAKEAHGSHLLLLSDCVQLFPGSLHAALRTLESEPKTGAVGGRVVSFDGTLQEAGGIIWRDGAYVQYGHGDNPFFSSYMFRRDIDYCSSAFLLTSRAAWEKLGGFDETFAPPYSAMDYCLRLWEGGFRVVYEPEAVALECDMESSQTATNDQELFVKRHRLSLKNRLAAAADSILHARTCPPPGSGRQRRVLFIDDRVPLEMLLALKKHGFFITFFPMAAIEGKLPREIEVMNEFGASLLEAFLRYRRGYYDAIVVNPNNMNRLKPIVMAHPDWFEHTDIVQDAEVLIASKGL